jgi:hypothetical protein
LLLLFLLLPLLLLLLLLLLLALLLHATHGGLSCQHTGCDATPPDHRRPCATKLPPCGSRPCRPRRPPKILQERPAGLPFQAHPAAGGAAATTGSARGGAAAKEASQLAFAAVAFAAAATAALDPLQQPAAPIKQRHWAPAASASPRTGAGLGARSAATRGRNCLLHFAALRPPPLGRGRLLLKNIPQSLQRVVARRQCLRQPRLPPERARAACVRLRGRRRRATAVVAAGVAAATVAAGRGTMRRFGVPGGRGAAVPQHQAVPPGLLCALVQRGHQEQSV